MFDVGTGITVIVASATEILQSQVPVWPPHTRIATPVESGQNQVPWKNQTGKAPPGANCMHSAQQPPEDLRRRRLQHRSDQLRAAAAGVGRDVARHAVSHGLRRQRGKSGGHGRQAGAHVTMITKLGRDVFGENTLKNFERFGIATQHVHFTDQAFSGVAPIAVDPEGRNSIIIVTGANDLLTPAEIEAARRTWQPRTCWSANSRFRLS